MIRIVAPSRLHFGMFSFGDARRRQFGGVGAMISSPTLEMTVSDADRLEIIGPLAERVEEYVRRWGRYHGMTSISRRLAVVTAPPQHVGLGSGTQLALAVGAALNASFGLPPMSAVELTQCMGRGQRSAVGTYGFFFGGLLIEEGKFAGEKLAPLRERIPLPEDWRFVLVRPQSGQGLSGEAERMAFRDLPPVRESVTRRLWEIVEKELAPAARRGDCEAFGEAVYQFGREAGMCFAARQGGPFASERLARWVAALRQMGALGVGQSSWGPTLFAVTPCQHAAEMLVERFVEWVGEESLRWGIAAPNNTGARCEIHHASAT